MNVIYLTEYSTRCYGVNFCNSGCIEVRNFENISNDEGKILYMKALKTVLGKSEIGNRTCVSGVFDESVFDGNILLLELSEENDNRRYVYFSGNMVCFFFQLKMIFVNISQTWEIL